MPDVLGAPRPEPVFGEEISKKAVVQEPVVETTAVTPTEVTEETQTPPVDEMVSGGETFDVTREDVRAMIDASYAHLSPEDREKIYEAAIKELGL